MKIQTSLIHLITLASLATAGWGQNDPPQARILSLSLDPQSVTVLNLRPGFVTSVRMPEEVSSVVVGDPSAFKGEHSEAEPRLVFFKPTVTKPARTNALISMRSGREVSLALASEGTAAHGPIDYVLDYQPPRSFLIRPTAPTFVIADRERLEDPTPKSPKAADSPNEHSERTQDQALDWQGKQLRVAVGKVEENGEDMTVSFSVLNASPRTIELLPPQIQLAGMAKQKHGKEITAAPVSVKAYQITTRKLAPGATAKGFVVFERPAFKQTSDRLLLQIAQVEEVDRPVLAAIAFVAPAKGAMQ